MAHPITQDGSSSWIDLLSEAELDGLAKIAEILGQRPAVSITASQDHGLII